jgi:predicted CoA-binding protein
MSEIPVQIRDFLAGSRFAVAGVSRNRQQPANAILRKLRDAGYEVVPINPNSDQLEGMDCYPDVASVPAALDGVVVATHPAVSASIVEQCAEAGVERVWFHRSFGNGSVSEDAVRRCEELGVDAIVGGCPLMFCEPIDFAHRCMRWWLQRQGSVPK